MERINLKVLTSTEDDRVNTKLNDVWRTCNKIRATVFRIGLNLWDYFDKLDPKRNALISESKFVNVLGRQLRNVVGLSEQEITELTDYFRVQDGRIAYKQFCNVIHADDPNKVDNENLVTGLEWEDPMHINRLSDTERRRLCLLMTKIAQSVRLREIVLRPYFQDYELVSKNNGTVTLAHFSRVLHFLGLVLSADDFALLVKRFIKDSYTVNYIAFVEMIDQIVRYFDTKRLVDYSDDIEENFPGKYIEAELPKLPRPEIDKVNIGQVFGKETSFHYALRPKKKPKSLEEVILRIKRHVFDNGLRVNEYFRDFDLLRTGYMHRSQFLRGLDNLGVSGLHRLYIWQEQLNELCDLYADEDDPTRINWKSFEQDIEEVNTKINLDKKPYEIVVSPEQKVIELVPDGKADWQNESDKVRNLCEEALFKIKARIKKRGLYLEPFFRDLDKLNISHVSRPQMRQVIFSNGILLSDEEVYALEKRYNDDMGFNYVIFLKEADPVDHSTSESDSYHKKIELVNAEKKQPAATILEKDIVQVLAKIKGIVVRRGIRVDEFLRGFDMHNEMVIQEDFFKRGINAANIVITPNEMDLICRVFKAPLREGFIDYKRFCEVIEEAVYQRCLEKAPLVVPLQHFPSDDSPKNFLNFDERNVVGKGMESLARYPDLISNLSSIFQDYDRVNIGTLPVNQFLRALTTRDLNNKISSKEFQTICKCFGVERGLRMEVDYRAFLKNLDLLYAIREPYPF